MFASSGKGSQVTKPSCAPVLFSIAPLLLLSGCPNGAITTPAPQQPMIVSGSLIGQRECGNITIDQTTFTFDCTQPLPNSGDTGWLLAPGTHTTANGTHLGNKAVVLTVTTPSLTDLDVEFVPPSGPTVPQGQIPIAPGQPDPNDVGTNGQVGVAETDNGTTKTWTLTFQLAQCSAVAALNISDVAADGTRSTMPLVVHLLRDPTQFSCSGTGGTTIGGNGNSGNTGSTGTSGGTMMNEVLDFAGTVSATNWAAVDLTSVPSPSASLAATSIPLPFTGAAVLSCGGALTAVANGNGGQLAVYESTAAHPIPQLVGQPINTGFAGVGAVKLAGTMIIVGEANGSKVVLIDISHRPSFTIGTPFTTSIQSIGSLDLSGSKAVVAGPNNADFEVLNISGLTASSAGTINPGLGTGLTLSLSGTVVAVGQVPPQNGQAANPNTLVALVDINTKATLATAGSGLGGITSISISGMKAVAGSSNNFTVAMIDFTPSPPSVTAFSPGSEGVSGGGWSVTNTAARMAIGNLNGSNVAVFGVTGAPVLLDKSNSAVSSVGSICIGDF